MGGQESGIKTGQAVDPRTMSHAASVPFCFHWERLPSPCYLSRFSHRLRGLNPRVGGLFLAILWFHMPRESRKVEDIA